MLWESNNKFYFFIKQIIILFVVALDGLCKTSLKSFHSKLTFHTPNTDFYQCFLKLTQELLMYLSRHSTHSVFPFSLSLAFPFILGLFLTPLLLSLCTILSAVSHMVNQFCWLLLDHLLL